MTTKRAPLGAFYYCVITITNVSGSILELYLGESFHMKRWRRNWGSMGSLRRESWASWQFSCMSWSSRYWYTGTRSQVCWYSGIRGILVLGIFSSGYFGNRYFGTSIYQYQVAQNLILLLQEIERLLAEETISELRSASGGMAPPLLLDVAYIEALPRDHLTRKEEREVKADNSFTCFPWQFLEVLASVGFILDSLWNVLSGASTGRGEEDPISWLHPKPFCPRCYQEYTEDGLNREPREDGVLLKNESGIDGVQPKGKHMSRINGTASKSSKQFSILYYLQLASAWFLLLSSYIEA